MTQFFQTQFGMSFEWAWGLATLAGILLIALPLMLAVAMIIYVDRKIWAAMALRRGPNVVGPWGLLQSFADGLKVFLQETIIPSAAASHVELGGRPRHMRTMMPIITTAMTEKITREDGPKCMFIAAPVLYVSVQRRYSPITSTGWCSASRASARRLVTMSPRRMKRAIETKRRSRVVENMRGGRGVVDCAVRGA